MKKKTKDLRVLPLGNGVICYLDDIAFEHVKALEYQIDKLKFEISKLQNLENLIHQYEELFDNIRIFKDSEPEDCKRGYYCEACEFSEPFFISNGTDRKILYMCKKGNTCPNFCQKVNNYEY